MMDKVLPHNLEAERATLGAILLDREAIIPLASWLKPIHFYAESHAWIYEAQLTCYHQRVPPDLQTISDELRRHERLDLVGGLPFLIELSNQVPTAYHVEYYAKIVERTAVLRSLIGAGTKITTLGYNDLDDVATTLNAAEQLVFAVSQQRSTQAYYTLNQLCDVYYEYLHQIDERGPELSGTPTGFVDFDNMTGGLQRTDLLILAARPGVGKSSLAMSMAFNIALQQGKPVGVFSLEMGREQLLQRLLTTYTGIDSQKLRTGRLSITELQTLTDALNKFATIPISIDDTAGMTISELRAKARRMQAEQGLEFLIIDYLQLINGSGRRNDNRVQEVGEISRSLKALARELNIPVLALSQLSRAVEGRSSHVPVLADLRECVVGSTRLVDATTGRWVPITDVRPGDHVLGVGTNQRIGSFIVHDVWSTGVKPVYTLTTRTGRTLTATSNHPIFTPSGWKQVGELQPGDLVATALRLPAHGHESVDDIDRCRLLGYLVGDGTYLQHRAVGFISSDTEAFADVVGIVQKHFPQVTVRMKRSGVPYQDGDFVCHYSNGYGKPGGNPLREWLRTHGMVGQRNTTKRIPAMVFEAGMAGAVAFLAGYFSADGCVKINDSKHHRPYWRIHFDTTSRGLAEDVQALLLRIGVIATISNGYQAKHGTCPIYRVVLATNASNLRCFAEQIVVPGRKGMLLQQMLQDLPERETNPGVFGLPPCISAYIAQRSLWKDQKKRMQRAHCLAWADRLNDPVLAQWATSDLLWEDIRSIEAAGEAEVFDIVVPGCGNFIANGIVAHNSGQIEADADMVIFIYREEMYDKDTDKKGIAELHIAKHRNGPLGTVDLFFDQRTTRFRNMTTYAAPEGY